MNHCGDCRMCCKLLGVREIEKPTDRWCKHACSAGCSIYESRPSSCVEYKCVWLISQEGEEIDKMSLAMRPDKSKVVLEAQGEMFLARLDPGNPTAWQNEPMFSFIQGMATRVPVLVGVTHSSTKVLLQSAGGNVVTRRTIQVEEVELGRQVYNPMKTQANL